MEKGKKSFGKIVQKKHNFLLILVKIVHIPCGMWYNTNTTKMK